MDILTKTVLKETNN